MNRNSAKNQAIKSKFVEREVYLNVNSMVEYILQKSYEDSETPFTYDDIENYYVPTCPECGETNSIIEMENEDEETIHKCSYCKAELDEEPEKEPQEIYEWYIVSNWLLRKLKEHGEPVIEHENLWGRTATGQAISLDDVISDICEGLEILEGQRNEWKI